MDTQQIDQLLKRKARGAKAARMGLYMIAGVLCVAILGGIVAGAYYAGAWAVDRLNSGPTAVETPTESLPVPPPTQPEPTTTRPTDPEPEPAEHILLLVWFGQEPELADPVRVTVYHGREQVTDLSLTAEGGWQGRWSDVYPAASLTLRGDFPAGMTGAVSVTGENFTLSAEYVPPTEPSEAPSSEPVPTQPLPEVLPDTGLVYWPGLVLLAAGLALLAIGGKRKIV